MFFRFIIFIFVFFSGFSVQASITENPYSTYFPLKASPHFYLPDLKHQYMNSKTLNNKPYLLIHCKKNWLVCKETIETINELNADTKKYDFLILAILSGEDLAQEMLEANPLDPNKISFTILMDEEKTLRHDLSETYYARVYFNNSKGRIFAFTDDLAVLRDKEWLSFFTDDGEVLAKDFIGTVIDRRGFPVKKDPPEPHLSVYTIPETYIHADKTNLLVLRITGVEGTFQFNKTEIQVPDFINFISENRQEIAFGNFQIIEYAYEFMLTEGKKNSKFIIGPFAVIDSGQNPELRLETKEKKYQLSKKNVAASGFFGMIKNTVSYILYPFMYILPCLMPL